MTTNNRFYLEVLQWAEKRESFLLPELVSEMRLDKDQQSSVVQQIVARHLFNPGGGTGRIAVSNAGPRLRLSLEDEFRLLEYAELQEARQSSADAMWAAKMAMVIAIISAIGSIAVNIYYGEKSAPVETSAALHTK